MDLMKTEAHRLVFWVPRLLLEADRWMSDMVVVKYYRRTLE